MKQGKAKFTPLPEKSTLKKPILVRLNGTVFDVLVDPSSIDKEYIFNIYDYLMVNNSIK